MCIKDSLIYDWRINMKYQYKCKACEYEATIEQSIKDDAIEHCPECQSPTFYRVIGKSNFILKGEGWASYENSGRYHE